MSDSKMISIRIKKDLYNKLEEVKKDYNKKLNTELTLSDICKMALKNLLEKEHVKIKQ